MATLVAVTAQQLAQSGFPDLPVRTSQRRSSSRTDPMFTRTYENVREWPNFTRDAAALLPQLDNEIPRYASPANYNPLAPCADEIGVRGALENLTFPAVDVLAQHLRIPFSYRSGGSGRSYSYTDMVILDTSIVQGTGERMELSHRVYGNGEAKGPWQWEVEGSCSLLEVLRNTKKQAKMIETVQQMYGDMVLDEAKYGFISNYNQTIFFRRSDNVQDKTLECSPTILVGESPLIAFVFVLFQAYQDKAIKQRLPRASVPVTPTGGYHMILPKVITTSSRGRARKQLETTITLQAGGKRAKTIKNRYVEIDLSHFHVDFFPLEELSSLPLYTLADFGLTGRVVGLGTYGNVVEGILGDCLPSALKLFDFRKEGAREAFVAEQIAYKHLKLLQGKCVPILYGVGCLAHCNMAFMAFSDEGTCKLGTSPLTRKVKKQVIETLDEIHRCGVLHNDIKFEHILISQGTSKFIDFQGCSTSASLEDLKGEQKFMLALLEDEMPTILSESQN